jgi:hypothetical protein
MGSGIGLVALAVLSSLATAYAIRLTAVSADVRRPDRRARALDEDLECWVMDDHRKLQAEIKTITGEHNRRNTLMSGMALADVAEAKTRALHRFRDRCAESDRALADMLAEEARPHELYRRWTRRSPLRLHGRDRTQPVIDDWRLASTVPGMEDQSPVYDPTRATLDDLIAELGER